MKHYECHPEAQVLGAAMQSFLESVNVDNFRDFLEERGLAEIDPDAWYSMQTLLDVLNDIRAFDQSSSLDFVSIGIKLIETAVLPPGIEDWSFHHVMKSYRDIYFANNQGAGIGDIIYEQIDEKHIVMHYITPYPDDYCYGVIYGFAQRLLPPGTDFTVSYDKTIPRREQGGAATLIHIEWE